MSGGDVYHKIVRRLSILRFFDLIDFPRPVLGAAEADNGELALVVDLVEGVLPLGDGVEDLFQAKPVGGGEVE